MHFLTRLFNYFKRTGFIVALVRPHLSDRDITQVSIPTGSTGHGDGRGQESGLPGSDSRRGLEQGRPRARNRPQALWATICAKAGARKVYALEANPKSYKSSLRYLKDDAVENVELLYRFSDRLEVPERCRRSSTI